jgi:CRP/FNR family transcriptional regulator, cyclic AMP receptor protein
MKRIDVIGRVFQENPLFSELSGNQKERMAGCAALMVFPQGTYIYREDAPAENFYLIRHGRVALEVHVPGQAPIIVDMLRDGDPLGWSWLIPPYKTHFDARAVDLTRVIRFDSACLREKMEEDHSFGYAVHKRVVPVIVARLAAARRQLIDLYGRPKDRGATWQ